MQQPYQYRKKIECQYNNQKYNHKWREKKKSSQTVLYTHNHIRKAWCLLGYCRSKFFSFGRRTLFCWRKPASGPKYIPRRNSDPCAASGRETVSCAQGNLRAVCTPVTSRHTERSERSFCVGGRDHARRLLAWGFRRRFVVWVSFWGDFLWKGS